MATERTNQYPSACEHCGKRVEEGEGILFRAGKRKGRWAVKHGDAERCREFTYSDYCDTVHPFSDENFSQGFGP